MTDAGIGDYFISDIDDGFDEDGDVLSVPVVVPVSPPLVARPVQEAARVPAVTPTATSAAATAAPAPAYAPRPPAAASVSADTRQTAARPASREERLVRALDDLMEHSPGVQAAALVSLDGFTMASALPPGMQEDRVGAMSAAILGLGERAATELGRGRLSQVFIEGADGYVLLMAAGDRAVLTALADADGKLGLIIYDMKQTAAEIGEALR